MQSMVTMLSSKSCRVLVLEVIERPEQLGHRPVLGRASGPPGPGGGGGGGPGGGGGWLPHAGVAGVVSGDTTCRCVGGGVGDRLARGGRRRRRGARTKGNGPRDGRLQVGQEVLRRSNHSRMHERQNWCSAGQSTRWSGTRSMHTAQVWSSSPPGSENESVPAAHSMMK